MISFSFAALNLHPQSQVSARSRPIATVASAAATAAILLFGFAPTTTAETSYGSGGTWDIGSDYKIMNWFPSGFNSGSAYSIVWNSQSVVFQWDISQYGFLHAIGRNSFWKKVDDSNSGSIAYHDHKAMISYRANSDAYTGLYGWLSTYPAPWTTGVEWYIIEDWMIWAPFPGSANWKGNITVDGDTYDIYNVKGGNYGTWNQWWSIRKNKRLKGNISYIQHMKKWRQLGMPNNNVYDVRFFVEPKGGGKGQVDYDWVIVNAP